MGFHRVRITLTTGIVLKVIYVNGTKYLILSLKANNVHTLKTVLLKIIVPVRFATVYIIYKKL